MLAISRLLGNSVFWVFFGFLGYPLLCLSAQWVWAMALPQVGFALKTNAFDLDTGSAQCFYFGPLLGVASAWSADRWEAKHFPQSRIAAFVGGVGCGVFALRLFSVIPLRDWAGEIGFLAPPLVWAACLILFAVLVRTPAK